MMLVLFHGTEIIAFIGSALLGGIILLGILIAIAVKPQFYKQISIGYFAIAAAIFLICNDLGSDLSIFLVSGVSFPWSWLVVLLSTFEYERDLGALLLLCGIVLNTILFFLLGKILLRRLKDSQ